MKAIFLDVDGVLNSKRTKRTTKSGIYTFVEYRYIKRVIDIINRTQAVVVLSSDWRYDRDDARYNQDYLELKEELEKWGVSFYGFTPQVDDNRGMEIDQYLKEHPEISNFVILDDRSDMEPHMNHLVKTKMRQGLTQENVETAVNILNNVERD